MKKMLGLVVVVPLLFGGLAACGGSDSGSGTTETTAAATPAETTAETAEATTEATEGAESGSAVDAYCQKVDEYAAEAKKLIENPTAVNATELQTKAQELQDTASQLTQELIDDPSKAQQVQECTQKLQQAISGQ